MSIELSRAAHYYGAGLPEPVEVWKGRLDDVTDVYFTQPYDRSKQSDTLTTAMTVTMQVNEDGVGFRYEFAPRHNSELTWPYRAMLGHAAIYPMDEEGNMRSRADAGQFEVRDNTGAILRQSGIYRARYLPQASEERI
jgi:hypothetical protein